jgi:hypothetical protein
VGLPWVRLDATFPHNAKVLQLIDEGHWRALSVYVFGLSYCGFQETDGHIPLYALRAIHARPIDAAALVTAGLWEVNGKGWIVHDWGDYQMAPEYRTLHKRAVCTRWMAQGKPCTCGTH